MTKAYARSAGAAPPSVGGLGAAGLPAVGPVDGLDQLLLGHRRAALDAEALGQIVEMPLRGVGIHTAGGPPAWPGRRATLGGLVVRQTLVLLGLPVVGDLLEAVLDGCRRRYAGRARRTAPRRIPASWRRCAVPSIASAARWTGCRRVDPSA